MDGTMNEAFRGLDEKILRLPAYFARRYARPGSDDYNEIRSAAAVELVRSVRAYDPARGAALGTYCYRRLWAESVRQKRALCRARSERPVSLDVALPSRQGWRDGTIAKYAVSHEPPAERALIARELVERGLAGETPQNRRIFLARHLEGMTASQVSERLGLGVSKQRVLQLLAKIEARFRRRLAGQWDLD